MKIPASPETRGGKEQRVRVRLKQELEREVNRIVNLKFEPNAVVNGAVRIDRRTKWGNPIKVGAGVSRGEAIARYRVYLWQRIRAGEITLEDLAALHGRRLACHCAPKPCHGEVLARAASWAASVLKNREG